MKDPLVVMVANKHTHTHIYPLCKHTLFPDNMAYYTALRETIVPVFLYSVDMELSISILNIKVKE